MAEKDSKREILSAALSAHVSELRLFWRETGLVCRWLVPDGEHCFVDSEAIKHLRDFRDRAKQEITSPDVCAQWFEKSAPLLETDEVGTMPFPLRTLTWLLRVAESPHRDDLTIDSWNLYLWSVRMHDLPSQILLNLTGYLDTDKRIVDFDTLVTHFETALKASMPTESEKLQQTEIMTLTKRFDRLRRFKNLVFYGVANIGKANISKQLMTYWRHMTGREIGMHCVTVFHKNVSYADMVERRISGENGSNRPSIDHCAPRVIAHHIHDAKYFFEPFTNDNIQEGLLLSLCRAAAYNPDKDYVFMVDCIDQAKIEDVFGEVSHMLDSFARVPWRKGQNGAGAWDLESAGARSIRLSQSGRIFFIPANVYILGTACEGGLFDKGNVDDHLFQTFAVEYLQAKTAEELRLQMLANRSPEAYARLEPYVRHSVDLWDKLNDILIHAGGHRNIIGYGPLLSMCEEILQSCDVHDANRIVLGTWRYRMLPPIRVKMETLLHSDDEKLHANNEHRRALDDIIATLNHSWLRMQAKIEGLPGSESLYMTFAPEFTV